MTAEFIDQTLAPHQHQAVTAAELDRFDEDFNEPSPDRAPSPAQSSPARDPLAATTDTQPAIPPSSRIRTTYSMWSMFRNCRMKTKLRYRDQLVPITSSPALEFGSVIHSGLEVWHSTREIERTIAFIEDGYSNVEINDRRKRDRMLAKAMLRGYAARYPSEDFEIVALEQTFDGEIVNPETGAKSRSFTLSGKIDGIVRMPDGSIYLLEHKTAASIDSDYLSKLWTDFQITLYSHYAEVALGYPIAGVLYNVLGKSGIKQSAGETEEEYQVRLADLIAKSKTGKSSAKRKMPETDEEFEARLAEWYSREDAFHREVIFIPRENYRVLQEELWEMTQAYLHAQRRDRWYQNTSQCFAFGACPYAPICGSSFNPIVIENQYRVEPPNQELGSPAGSGFSSFPIARGEAVAETF